MTTGIEWTDETWNPVIGCSKTSPGCDNCYAIDQAHRNTAMQEARPDLAVRAYVPPLTSDRNVGIGDRDVDWTGELRLLPDRLAEPLRWKKPRRVFVNSMSDLFHVGVPNPFIVEVFDVMAAAQRHTFQVLTKRSQRMMGLLNDLHFASEWGYAVEERLDADGDCDDPGELLRLLYGYDVGHFGRNIWLGVSVESAKYRFRLDHLRSTPAAVRWVSFEPLLGPVGAIDLTGIDWVVVGGESGKDARPMHPDWAREIRDQCIDQGVAFFFKQWGGHSPTGSGYNPRDVLVLHGDAEQPCAWMRRERSKNFEGHDVLDGQRWNQYPGHVG